MSSAGDINIDGIPDILIGAYGAAPYDHTSAGSSYVIYGSDSASLSASASPLDSPSCSSSSRHNVPWYSPASWLSSLKKWWNTQENIDTTLPYVNEMLEIKSQIKQVSQLSSDRWFQFSLEDMAEDMDLTLKNPQNIQKDTIKDMQKRLKGIQKDFLYENASQFNGLFADQVQPPLLKEPMIALNPSLASLNYQGITPPMLTK